MGGNGFKCVGSNLIRPFQSMIIVRTGKNFLFVMDHYSFRTIDILNGDGYDFRPRRTAPANVVPSKQAVRVRRSTERRAICPKRPCLWKKFKFNRKSRV